MNPLNPATSDPLSLDEEEQSLGFRPVPLAEEEDVSGRLGTLVADRAFTEAPDREFQSHVRRQYKRVFPDPVPAVDATGRRRDTRAATSKLDLFKPRPDPVNANLTAAVGAGRANKPDDVWGLKKALSAATGTGLDLTRERSEDFGDRLVGNLKGFQKVAGLKVDGVANPGGPTATALRGALERADTSPVSSRPPIADSSNSKDAPGTQVAQFPGPGHQKPTPPKPDAALRRKAEDESVREFDRLSKSQMAVDRGPGESPRGDASKQARRAVIVDTAQGSYVMLKPGFKAPKDAKTVTVTAEKAMRLKRFQLEIRNIDDFYPPNEAEIARIKERIARGEKVHGTVRSSIKYGRKGSRLSVKYRNGDIHMLSDINLRPLFVPGDRDIVWTAEKAFKLGLGDWRMVPPPDPAEKPIPPVPPLTLRGIAATVLKTSKFSADLKIYSENAAAWNRRVDLWQWGDEHKVPEFPFVKPATKDKPD